MSSWTLSQEQVYLLAIMLPLITQLVGLSFAAIVDVYIGKRQKRLFLLIYFLALSLIAQNWLELRLSVRSPQILLRTACSVYGYCARPLILLLFFYLVRPKGSFLVGWCLVGVNTAIYLTALIVPWSFYIDEVNHYHSGPLGSTCLAVSLILLGWLSWLTLQKSRENRGREIWIPLFIAPVLLCSLVLDSHVTDALQPVSFLTIAIVCCCTLYYIWLHLQFVRTHERDMEAKQRMQLMFSQIKPHFLYNALGAIETLCDMDPQAAKVATVRFSKFLRNNLSAISAEEPVLFEQELSHTRLYLELEQTRFGDALQVDYDIQCADFFMPALTLEPLAENAVRHGIRKKIDGRGTVLISTRELSDRYEISVTDDGPGFDPSRPISDGREHFGIQNVRGRLAELGGTLTIRSAPGQGTTAVIWLPKSGRR